LKGDRHRYQYSKYRNHARQKCVVDNQVVDWGLGAGEQAPGIEYSAVHAGHNIRGTGNNNTEMNDQFSTAPRIYKRLSQGGASRFSNTTGGAGDQRSFSAEAHRCLD